MRITVTGGCGFIGSHVVDRLVAEGHDVLALDARLTWRNPVARSLRADIFDPPALAAAVDGCDVVFHLAGAADVNEVAADPLTAIRLNVEGTGRVLEAARNAGCERIVLASTVWVYGATVGDGERTEDAPVDVRRAGHLYVSTKLAAELLVHSYRQMHGLEYTILRYGIPYGPRMRDALVTARFVSAARNGEPITIAGTGEQQRNFVYVEDLAHAHVLALDPAAANQTLALEGDTPVSVNEIAETVQRLVRPVSIVRVPARTADYSGSVSISNRLAKELLNWAPTTPLAEGIRRYLAWLGGASPSALPRPARAAQAPAIASRRGQGGLAAEAPVPGEVHP